MQFNNNGLNLIKTFEGLRLDTYLDQAGNLTVGYGHKVLSGDNLKLGDIITQEQADVFLQHDLQRIINGVDSMIQTNLTDNQFSALVDFAYNLGLGSLQRSTLLVDINNNAFGMASQEFLKWNHVNGIISAGLTRRRQAEQTLFNS